MRNDVPLRVKNQTTLAKTARRASEVRHCTGSQIPAASRPCSSVVGRSSSSLGMTPEFSELRRKGSPASRQAQLNPGQVKGSTQNHVPSTETINEAQITVSYILVTGGRPAIRTRSANPQAE